jgi:predicted small metal-binding protein
VHERNHFLKEHLNAEQPIITPAIGIDALTGIGTRDSIRAPSLPLGRRRCKVSKVLTCRDVGVECDFVARGATVEEVMEKAREHATKDHGFADIPPELVDNAKAAIRDEEAATA